MLDRTEEPDEMTPELARCTAKERAFIAHYLLLKLERQQVKGPAQDAAEYAGYGHENSKSTTLAKQARQMFQRPRVAQALAAESLLLLRSHGPLLVKKLIEMIEDPATAATARIRAINVGMTFVFPTHQQVDVRHTHTVDIDHTQAALEALRWLRTMQVPREKLVEQFGINGLPRYERALDEEDRAAGKLIEGRVEAPGSVEKFHSQGRM
jgi:hypothetical protein